MSKMTPNWYGYYSEKRILQQWKQLELLKHVNCSNILEIGPAGGLVTGMAVNAGYKVETLDHTDRSFEYPDVDHLKQDLKHFDSSKVSKNTEVILCCEVFEHLPWNSLKLLLKNLHKTSAKWLICSVPYEAFQIYLSLYLNLHFFKRQFSLKKFRSTQKFKPGKDPYGHKWEVGYKGYSLKAWELLLESAGWRIERRDFTVNSRAVFHVLEKI